MEENYRNKIKEIESCLKRLDDGDLSEESVAYLEKGWAALMLSYSHTFPAPETNHQLVFLDSSLDSKGNMVLELSKAKMSDTEQSTFDKFMFACKSGESCFIADEDTCAEKFKEILSKLPDGTTV